MSHILIVEDEKSINDLIAMNLALVGHTSEQVYDGTEALEFLKQNIYALIIMDIMLPGMNGFVLMEHVSEDAPVIFLTAMSNLFDRVKGFKLGADDYIMLMLVLPPDDFSGNIASNWSNLTLNMGPIFPSVQMIPKNKCI